MSEPDKEHLQEARRWLVYARDDLAAAEVLAGDPDVSPRQACWLAQQAAEKALKAALCFLQSDFGKTQGRKIPPLCLAVMVPLCCPVAVKLLSNLIFLSASPPACDPETLGA